MHHFSLLLPTYNTPVHLLDACIRSVFEQTHAAWQLCIVDDGSTSTETLCYLRGLTNLGDERVVVQFLDENIGISGATNKALELATGKFVVLLDHDDLLEPDALELISGYLTRYGELDFVYSDEYHLYPDGSVHDFVKPDWSPERLRSQMYICHLLVVRTSLAIEVGGMRVGFEGAQDHDFALRISENTTRIGHIPLSLYYWRVNPMSFSNVGETRGRSLEAGRRAVQEHCDRVGINAVVEHGPHPGTYRLKRALTGTPKVSVVIPTRGTGTYVWGKYVSLVEQCVESLLSRTTYRNIEIIVVADTSTPLSTIEFLSSLDAETIRIVYYDRPFNFSDKINIGVVESTGDVVMLLNDDTMVIDEDWCHVMLGLLEHDDIGVVGNLLVFANQRLQHGGHQYVDGNPTHVGFNVDWTDGGAASMYGVEREVSGVTAAAAMLRRSVFDEVGGMSTRFPNNFNDVDFCQKVRQRGYRIVWTPHAKMFHFESVSRNATVTPREMWDLTLTWYREMRNDVYDSPIQPHLLEWVKSGERRKPGIPKLRRFSTSSVITGELHG